MAIKVGALIPVAMGNANPEFVEGLGTALEERGFESVWIPEHVVLFDDYESAYPYTPDGRMPIPADAGLLDPFPTLSFLAATTTTLRLGTGVCIVSQRNPVYTAKYVADLDVLSGGRFDFGIGLGWLREEYEALDVPWEGRGKRANEYLEVMEALWTGDVSAHHTSVYELPPSRMYPKPVQDPHPPVHVGGDSDAALRRVALHGQGWFGMGQTPETLPERLERLDAALAEQGRSRDEIQISISPPPGSLDAEMAKGFEELGVHRLLPAMFAPGLEAMTEMLDQMAAELIS